MKPPLRFLLVLVTLLSSLLLSPRAYSQYWTFSGADDDIAQSITQTPGGGYVVAGWTESFGAGGKDLLILSLTASAGIQWQKAFGGTGDDTAYSIQLASDSKYGDGYIVAGETNFLRGRQLRFSSPETYYQWRYSVENHLGWVHVGPGLFCHPGIG